MTKSQMIRETTIWHAAPLPSGLGYLQRHALAFIRRVANWHTFDKRDKKTIQSLSVRGLVEVNEFNQFRANNC